MSRTVAREVAFKTVYSQMFLSEKSKQEDASDDLYGSLTDVEDLEFVAEILHATAEHYSDINELLTANLRGYSPTRVFKIDLAIIFVALCEILYIKKNPNEVIVNEAIELAKKFSTENSPKFINGFLANFTKKAN